MLERVFSRRAAFALASLVAFTVLLVTGGSALARSAADGADAQQYSVAKQSSGIVASISKSPVSPDGNVAGARTDLVINLNQSMDPAVPGLQLQAGDVVTVTLPQRFARTGPEPFTAGGPGCYLTCNGIIMLQGWPQFPAVPFGSYSPSYDDATRTITMPLSGALGSPGGSPFVGVKQIHLLLTGFTNPTRPGKHRIEVTITRNGVSESGWANVEIRPRVEPSIHVTSVFADGNDAIPPPQRLNPLYQSTASGLRPVTLLLWDDDGAPFVGVSLEAKGSGDYRLVQDGRTVGQVKVVGPKRGDLAIDAGPSTAFAAPITGIPTGRLIVEFVPGDRAGVYTVTFSLNGGNDVTFVITAS